MESNEEIEYRNKLNTCANSLADKMSILDTRDKLMQLKRSRQTNLATAVATIGTCPDMCPEKERYFRMETNQMALFEMDTESGFPDEYRMVKEYRRSGADQEEPLPQELRPVPILNRTMDYLCTNIMDLLEPNTSCGDWFDFIWSRTRSIRKDITQQHLCDEQAVALTEKCARFHIHCSATLCEQDVKDFDPKINDENLSNCLQTLKDLYYDLSLKGIYCPNEAEFRCYEVLLHLNDTSILKDVHSYRREVRDSAEVKLAVRALRAFQFNNYFRFFHMINECTYLMACVLHRFFTDMRHKAFKILRKSFTSNSSSVQEYSTLSLVNTLGFEDIDELAMYCNQIGLECSQRSVYMTRIQRQNNPIKNKRSFRLIDTKRVIAVGEVIYGSKLPPNPYKAYPLHNSFDSDGKLNLNAYDATDQKIVWSKSEPKTFQANTTSASLLRSSQSFTTITKPSGPPLVSASLASRLGTVRWPTPPTPVASDQIDNTKSPDAEKSLDNELLDQVCDNVGQEIVETTVTQMINGICGEVIDAIVLQQAIGLVFADIFLNTCQDLIKEVAKQVLEELQLKSKAEQLANELSEELYDEFVVSEIKDISKETLTEIRQQSVQKIIESIGSDIFKELLDEISAEVCSSVLSFEICLRKTFLEEQRIKRLQTKYWLKWRKWFVRVKRLNLLSQTFPAAPNWSTKTATSPPSKPIVSKWIYFSEDLFEKSIERELKANTTLNYLIDSEIRRIASEVMLEFSERSAVVDYIRQNHVKRLQSQYFTKWKDYAFRRRLVSKRKATPAAPLWTQNGHKSSPSERKHEFFDVDIESKLKAKAKRFKRNQSQEVMESEDKEEKEEEVSKLRPLFENELSESKKLTERLAQELSSGSTIELINQSNSECEDNVFEAHEEDEDDNIEVVEVFETQTDKINRLKRLLSEEKDYFSLHKFVQYLATNEDESS